MATVNFSVPDDVKSEFDRFFGDQNKSAVIAELMRTRRRSETAQAAGEYFPRADTTPCGPTFPDR